MRKNRYTNYISEVMCSNCRKRGRIKIPYGTSIDLIPCPQCGKLTLHHPSYFGAHINKDKEIKDERSL